MGMTERRETLEYRREREERGGGEKSRIGSWLSDIDGDVKEVRLKARRHRMEKRQRQRHKA